MKYVLLIFCLWLVLMFVRASADPVRGAGSESAEPSAPANVIFSGNSKMAYRFSRDKVGIQTQELKHDAFLKIIRQSDAGLNMEARINYDGQKLAKANPVNIDGLVSLKHARWELLASGDLSTTLKTTLGVARESRSREFNADLLLKLHRNFPLTVGYSRDLKQDSESDSTAYEAEHNEWSVNLQGRTRRIQTSLDLNIEEIREPICSTTIRKRSAVLKSVISLTRFLKVDLGAKPSDSNTKTSGAVESESSEDVEYMGGFNASVSRKLRLSGGIRLGNSMHKTSRDTSGTVGQAGDCDTEGGEFDLPLQSGPEMIQASSKTLVQDYSLSFRPLGVLSVNAGASLSDTMDASKSQRVNGSIDYRPKGSPLLGRTDIKVQVSRVKDSGGQCRARDITSSLSNVINLTSLVQLSSALRHSVADKHPVTGEGTSNANLSVKAQVSHKVSEAFEYKLAYDLRDKNSGTDSKNRTNTYAADVASRLPFRRRGISLALNQTLTYSRTGGEGCNKRTSKASVMVPISRCFSASYSLVLGASKSGLSPTRRTTENKAGVEVGGTDDPFFLRAEYAAVAASMSATKRTLKTAFAYSLPSDLALDLSFIQSRTSGEAGAPSNLTACLKYTF